MNRILILFALFLVGFSSCHESHRTVTKIITSGDNDVHSGMITQHLIFSSDSVKMYCINKESGDSNVDILNENQKESARLIENLEHIFNVYRNQYEQNRNNNVKLNMKKSLKQSKSMNDKKLEILNSDTYSNSMNAESTELDTANLPLNISDYECEFEDVNFDMGNKIKMECKSNDSGNKNVLLFVQYESYDEDTDEIYNKINEYPQMVTLNELESIAMNGNSSINKSINSTDTIEEATNKNILSDMVEEIKKTYYSVSVPSDTEKKHDIFRKTGTMKSENKVSESSFTELSADKKKVNKPVKKTKKKKSKSSKGLKDKSASTKSKKTKKDSEDALDKDDNDTIPDDVNNVTDDDTIADDNADNILDDDTDNILDDDTDNILDDDTDSKPDDDDTDIIPDDDDSDSKTVDNNISDDDTEPDDKTDNILDDDTDTIPDDDKKSDKKSNKKSGKKSDKKSENKSDNKSDEEDSQTDSKHNDITKKQLATLKTLTDEIKNNNDLDKLTVDQKTSAEDFEDNNEKIAKFKQYQKNTIENIEKNKENIYEMINKDLDSLLKPAQEEYLKVARMLKIKLLKKYNTILSELKDKI